MGSNKAYILLGLFMAIALLISSEVSARELAETEKNDVAATIDGHGGGGPGGGFHGGCRHGWCGRHCCNYAGQAVDAEENSVADTESKYQGGGGWNQGGGYHGGGGGWNQGGGYHGGGGGWNQGGGGGWNQGGGGYHGGGCRHGWCGRHCCYAGQTADAEAAETQN
ncbi:hypothetical protein AgCh_003635 [Apium graveolens]